MESSTPFNNGLAVYKIIKSSHGCDFFVFNAQLSGPNIPNKAIITEIDWLFVERGKSGTWLIKTAYQEFNNALDLFAGGDVCFPPGNCVGGSILPRAG